MNPLPLAAFFSVGGQDDGKLWRVFDAPTRAFLESQTRLLAPVVSPSNFAHHAQQLRDVEVVFSTWGMWPLSSEQLDAMPQLKAVFYAAGSVQGFARPLLERNIVLTSSWAANAVPVAEFCLAQILLANKGLPRNRREYHRQERGAFSGRGNFGATVSLLGAGQIGRRVVELLRPFELKVCVFDPFLSSADARDLGVEHVELDAAFARGDVVSNHLANLPATRRMLRGSHFASMPPNATFINTGRGQTVDTDELVEVLRARPDLTALLDVTEPEPLPLSHPLRALPNVELSSHIAGSIGDEVARMGHFAVEEFEAWRENRPLRFGVTLQLLETMA